MHAVIASEAKQSRLRSRDTRHSDREWDTSFRPTGSLRYARDDEGGGLRFFPHHVKGETAGSASNYDALAMTDPKRTDTDLLRFYRGTGPDVAGRRIEDIWSWDQARLEYTHDFVQWLFPLPTRSAFNPDAPLLTDADRAAFTADPELQERMLRSLDVMLAFYGFIRGEASVARTADFNARASQWLAPNNHNHLRLSRILQSLRLCGLAEQAMSLHASLQETAEDFPGRVTETTRRFWREAASGT